MINSKIANFTQTLVDNKVCAKQNQQIVVYGLKVFFELFLSVATTIVLGLVFNFMPQSMFFLVSFSLIRCYAGGYHCKKASTCYIVSTMLTFTVIFIAKTMQAQYITVMSIMLLIFSLPILLMLILHILNFKKYSFIIVLSITLSASLVLIEKVNLMLKTRDI